MKANRPAKSNYPNNVTLKDFVLFMWTPWLVYADYPRRKTINYTYAFKKAFNTIMVLMVMYMVHTSFMQPWIEIGSSITMI